MIRAEEIRKNLNVEVDEIQIVVDFINKIDFIFTTMKDELKNYVGFYFSKVDIYEGFGIDFMDLKNYNIQERVIAKLEEVGYFVTMNDNGGMTICWYNNKYKNIQTLCKTDVKSMFTRYICELLNQM